MSDKNFLDIAIEALLSYSFENAQLTQLGGASNINFKVDVENKSYVLRLHTSTARHEHFVMRSRTLFRFLYLFLCALCALCAFVVIFYHKDAEDTE